MSLWERLTQFFVGSAPSRVSPGEDAASESAVGVLEPEDAVESEADAAAEADDELDELLAPNLWWVPEGEPVLTPPEEPDQPHAPELREFLSHWLTDPQIQLPMLPRMAQKGLGMLRDEQVQFARLADVVAQDAALAAEVLRLVNTTSYARMFKVNRLEVAFTRLGSKALRSLLTTVSVKGLLPAGSGTRGTEFWEHAIVSATLMEEMSRDDAKLCCDDAFLAGLLHDIGELALLKPVRDFERSRRVTVSPALWRAMCAELHGDLGKRMALEWKLAAPLPDVIGDHHAPVAERDRCERYRLLVQFADVFSAMRRYTPYVPYDFFNLACVRRLGIRDDEGTREWLESLSSLIMERTGVYLTPAAEGRDA